MYAMITGQILEAGNGQVVVDCGGIGFEVFTTTEAISGLKNGETARFHTHLVVSDTAMVLYGFLTREEKSMFRQLITISGIGPKLGLAILSGMSVAELTTAIITADEKAFGRVSGVGKKTAQRVILELKNKVSADDVLVSDLRPSLDGGSAGEAVEVLIAMQIPPEDAAAAVALVKAEGGTAEQMAVRALRTLDRN